MARRPRSRSAARAAATPPRTAPAPADPRAGRAFAIALLVVLAGLAAAYAVCALSPSMWVWGLVAMRYVPALAGWLTWAAFALALVPAIGARAAPACERIGDWLARRPAALVAAPLFGAALVWMLPDRTLFLGDFAMRSGTVLTGTDPVRLFPQAMALDLLVHVRLPETLIRFGWTTQLALRTLGALGAALLAWTAIRLPRALGLGGAPALAAAAIVFGGGTLGMFTGYGKSAIELTAFTALAGVAALAAVRQGRSLATLGLTVALALGFHRTGLLLVPLAALALALAPGRWARPSRLLGAGFVITALAAFGPRAVRLITTFDMLHHLAPAETHGAGGVLTAWLEPLHLLDVLNVVLVLAPLAPALLAVPFAWSGLRDSEEAPAVRRGVALVLLALALPAVALLLVTRPQQGIFRDRDVFAPSAIALSVLVATLVARALRGTAARGALTAGVVLAAIVPSLQWMALMNRPHDSLRYIADYIQGPPARAQWDRAATWDYLGMRALVDKRYEDASRAFAQAVDAAQNPRLIGEWGIAELMHENYARAESLFIRAVQLNPRSIVGWNGLAASASYLGDTAACALAEVSLTRLDPGNRHLPDLRAFLARARAGQH